MRSIITISVLIAYTISVNCYIHHYYATDIIPYNLKLWYYWSMLIMLLFYKIDLTYITNNKAHKIFNKLSFYTVLINIILITFTYQFRILSPVKAFLIFDGGIVVTSIPVLISGLHRGLFK